MPVLWASDGQRRLQGVAGGQNGIAGGLGAGLQQHLVLPEVPEHIAAVFRSHVGGVLLAGYSLLKWNAMSEMKYLYLAIGVIWVIYGGVRALVLARRQKQDRE